MPGIGRAAGFEVVVTPEREIPRMPGPKVDPQSGEDLALDYSDDRGGLPRRFRLLGLGHDVTGKIFLPSSPAAQRYIPQATV